MPRWLHNLKNNFETPFYRWTSKLEPLLGGGLLFTSKFPEIAGSKGHVALRVGASHSKTAPCLVWCP